MKREIIIQPKDTDQYRIVCRFGYDYSIDYAWWGHLQKKTKVKKWIFFGEEREKWTEIQRCWWSKEINTTEELEKLALDLYDENILLPKRLVQKAMSL